MTNKQKPIAMPYMNPPPGFGYEAQDGKPMEEMKIRARQQARIVLGERPAQIERLESYGAIGQERSAAGSFKRHSSRGSSHRQQDSQWATPLRPTYDRPVNDPPVYQMYEPTYERPITPHDTYRYPDEHLDSFVPTPILRPMVQLQKEALAGWYAERIVNLLIVPGSYRSGVGGAADLSWSDEGREWDAWERVGDPLPPRWADASSLLPGTVRGSHVLDRHDPWNITWRNTTAVVSKLSTFIYEVLERMSCTSTHAVAAVWYISGLGLHELDPKGLRIRQLLRESIDTNSPETIEHQVAILGLVLAGKWLDDNSFQTISWTEVTGLQASTINRLEIAALKDLHFSLSIPTDMWMEHVQMNWSYIKSYPSVDSNADALMTATLEQLANDVRNVDIYCQAESNLSQLPTSIPEDDWTMSSVPSIGERFDHIQPEDYPFEEAHEVDLSVPYLLPSSFSPAMQLHDNITFENQIEAHHNIPAALPISALINKNNMEIDDDDEDDFLEYDGAVRWLPSMAELGRSISHGSEKSDSLEVWRLSVKMAAERGEIVEPFVYTPTTVPGVGGYPVSRCVSPSEIRARFEEGLREADQARERERQKLEYMAEAARYGDPAACDHGHWHYVPEHASERHHHCHAHAHAHADAYNSAHGHAHAYAPFKETGVHFEPGIVQVRPGTSLGAPTSAHQYRPRLVHLDPMTLKPLDPDAVTQSGSALRSNRDQNPYSQQEYTQYPEQVYPTLADSYVYQFPYPFQCSNERERAAGSEPHSANRVGIAGWY